MQWARNAVKRKTGFLHVAYSSFLCPELLAILSDLHSEGADDPVLRMTSLHTGGIIQDMRRVDTRPGSAISPSTIQNWNPGRFWMRT